MFVDESLWIRQALERARLAAGMTVLDIGSSTRVFRTLTQPHIDGNVFEPLRQRGIVPIHLDARAAEGVDIVADVATPGRRRANLRCRALHQPARTRRRSYGDATPREAGRCAARAIAADRAPTLSAASGSDRHRLSPDPRSPGRARRVGGRARARGRHGARQATLHGCPPPEALDSALAGRLPAGAKTRGVNLRRGVCGARSPDTEEVTAKAQRRAGPRTELPKGPERRPVGPATTLV